MTIGSMLEGISVVCEPWYSMNHLVYRVEYRSLDGQTLYTDQRQIGHEYLHDLPQGCCYMITPVFTDRAPDGRIVAMVYLVKYGGGLVAKLERINPELDTFAEFRTKFGPMAPVDNKNVFQLPIKIINPEDSSYQPTRPPQS